MLKCLESEAIGSASSEQAGPTKEASKHPYTRYSICNLLNQVLQYFKRNQKQSVIYYLKLQQWVPFCHSGHIWWTPSWLRLPYTGCWYRGSEGRTLEALLYPGWLYLWPTQQLFTNRMNNHLASCCELALNISSKISSWKFYKKLHGHLN